MQMIVVQEANCWGVRKRYNNVDDCYEATAKRKTSAGKWLREQGGLRGYKGRLLVQIVALLLPGRRDKVGVTCETCVSGGGDGIWHLRRMRACTTLRQIDK